MPAINATITRWGVAVCNEVEQSARETAVRYLPYAVMEGDLIRTIRDHIRWVGQFPFTAGVPGRQDIDNSQEINYAAICKAIAATNYESFCGA